jgi:hypothetical protein
LKELGLNPHYTGRNENKYLGFYDFILDGTENNPMSCNIANYIYPMQSLQFFVNKERNTFGRLHGAPDHIWDIVG